MNDRASPAEAHYRKMYERVSGLAKIGVWECDLASEELSWTDTVYDLFDLPRGSSVSRDAILALYRQDSREQMERLRADAVRNGTSFSLDIAVRTSRGEERWIRLTADVEQEQGRSVRIFGTKQDISKERAAQEKVQALQTELIHVSRASGMSTMGAALAHELNQPLTAIVNYISAARRLLGRAATPPDLLACIEAAGDAALRAGEIIRGLRQMTIRGSPGAEDFEFGEVLKEALDLACADEPAVAISYDVEQAGRILADRLQVQQVIFNLIRNALDAAAGGRCEVEISAHRRAGALEVTVADNGPGIATEMLPRVFDSFVTNKAEGMGMGLSISRTIVERQGGRISARNRPGGGASISFILPLAPVT